MTSRRAERGTARPNAPVGPEELPLLAGFFRGTLHEDFGLESGTVDVAARSWLGTLTPEERAGAAREADRLLAALEGVGIVEVRKLLGRFGAAWWPRRRREVDSLLELLAGEKPRT